MSPAETVVWSALLLAMVFVAWFTPDSGGSQ